MKKFDKNDNNFVMMLWNKRSNILPLRIDIFVDYDHVNVWVCFLNDSLFNHKVSCCHVVWHAIILHYTRVHDVKDIHDLYKHVTLIVEGQYKTIISMSCQQATLDESTKILHTLFSKAHWNKIILFFKIWIKIHNKCC